MELAGSFWRYAVSHFLREADAAFSSYTSVLSFGGVPMPSSLCHSVAAELGVLSAVCDDLASFVVPQPAAAYNATACDWPRESVRPWFLGFQTTPAACVASYPPLPAPPPSPPPVPRGGAAGGTSWGASTLAFFGGVALALGGVWLVSRKRGFDAAAARMRARQVIS